MLANDKDFLATRVSYELNLKGPSLTIQDRVLDFPCRRTGRVRAPAQRAMRRGAGGR